MNRTVHKSRRNFLRNLGLGSAALPLIPSSIVQGQSPSPKRLVVFHTPNGICRPGYRPRNGASFGPVFKPLIDAGYSSRLLVLDGIGMHSCDADPNFAANHPELYTHNLTGQNMRVDGSLPHYQRFFAGGPSVDQVIAEHLRSPEHVYESLVFAVGPQGMHSSQSRLFYRKDLSPVPYLSSPQDAFDKIFAGLMIDASAEPSGPDPALLRRTSIIDTLRAELDAVRSRVGRNDHQRIDAHLEGLRIIEKQLQASSERSSITAACAKPDPDRYSNQPGFVRDGLLHMDMLAMALACNLTPVANIQWGFGSTNMSLPWLGLNLEHHGLSHGRPESASTDQRTAWSIQIQTWYGEMLLHLVRSLASLPEGGGTVLDNTIIVWTSEHSSRDSDSGGHDFNIVPFTLIGNVAGQLRTGRTVTVPGGRSHNDLFVTLCNLYGMPSTTFGNPEVCTGAISGLTV